MKTLLSLPNPLFEHAKLNDLTVATMLKAGEGPEAIIGQLVADKEQYIKRIMELEGICPRKIVLADGRVVIWQCPINLL